MVRMGVVRMGVPVRMRSVMREDLRGGVQVRGCKRRACPTTDTSEARARVIRWYEAWSETGRAGNRDWDRDGLGGGGLGVGGRFDVDFEMRTRTRSIARRWVDDA